MYYPKENKTWYRSTEIEVPEILRISRNICLVDGEKFDISHNKGCRGKLIIKSLGIIIKFNDPNYEHNDYLFYSKIEEEDRKFFPKLLFDSDHFSIHEYVEMIIPTYDISFSCAGRFLDSIEVMSKIPNFKTSAEYYQEALSLRDKYDFNDFCCDQYGVRLDNGSLCYFDYGMN